jgi:hypothetical protein
MTPPFPANELAIGGFKRQFSLLILGAFILGSSLWAQKADLSEQTVRSGLIRPHGKSVTRLVARSEPYINPSSAYHTYVAPVPASKVTVAGAAQGVATIQRYALEPERWRNYAGPSQETIRDHEVNASDYIIHQAVELGGHLVSYSGNSAVWDNMVNIFSGPRFLTQSLEMHAIDHKGKLFDDLNMNSFGYGGDPNTSTLLRFSKGRIYNFHSLLRRDRQYFDYDLLANPLSPITTSPYKEVRNSPHLFNTVRKMGDFDLMILPFARVDYRIGYSGNIAEGPTFSTVVEDAEPLLNQNWRNSTDTYRLGIDWKMLRLTSISFDEIITHYKGNTSWSLAGLDYQLPNGTPVSIGIDIFPASGTPCAAPIANAATTPPTVNPACNGTTAYTRTAPTRVIYPTEQLHFESTSVHSVQMTGRLVYSGSHGNLSNYNETWSGYQSRIHARHTVTTGYAKTQIINVAADYGLTWQINRKWVLSDAFNFWDFRDPGVNSLTSTTFTGVSMLSPLIPPPGGPVTTDSKGFLAQKTTTNTILAEYQVIPMLRLSAGYRYRARTIGFYSAFTPSGENVVPIHEDWAIFGAHFQPGRALVVNMDIDAMSADRAYTRISPRQLQDYKIYTTYTPKPSIQLSSSITIFESRDNVADVHHLQHNRDYSFGATITPDKYWTVDAHYAYTDYYTRTDVCYASTPTYPAGAKGCPTTHGYLLGNGLYSEPTNFGTIDIGVHPADRMTANFGYTASEVNGNAEYFNPRQVPGSLQSIYETAFANTSFILNPKWTLKGGWAYNEYGEGTPIGPTLPRSFRGNLFTIGARYAF